MTYLELIKNVSNDLITKEFQKRCSCKEFRDIERIYLDAGKISRKNYFNYFLV